MGMLKTITLLHNSIRLFATELTTRKRPILHSFTCAISLAKQNQIQNTVEIIKTLMVVALELIAKSLKEAVGQALAA